MWFCFFFSSRRRHTRCGRDWSSDVCSSDLVEGEQPPFEGEPPEAFDKHRVAPATQLGCVSDQRDRFETIQRSQRPFRAVLDDATGRRRHREREQPGERVRLLDQATDRALTVVVRAATVRCQHYPAEGPLALLG